MWFIDIDYFYVALGGRGPSLSLFYSSGCCTDISHDMKERTTQDC